MSRTSTGLAKLQTICATLVLLSFLVAACTPSNADTQELGREVTRDKVTIATFLDTWYQRSGDEHGLWRITLEKRNGETAAFVSLWGQKEDNKPDVHVDGEVQKETGEVVALDIYGSVRGDPYAKDRIEILLPFVQIGIGVMDSRLSDEEIDGILDELHLSTDLLDELRTATDHKQAEELPVLVKNGISYRLDVLGSEIGGTIQLQIRVLQTDSSTIR